MLEGCITLRLSNIASPLLTRKVMASAAEEWPCNPQVASCLEHSASCCIVPSWLEVRGRCRRTASAMYKTDTIHKMQEDRHMARIGRHRHKNGRKDRPTQIQTHTGEAAQATTRS